MTKRLTQEEQNTGGMIAELQRRMYGDETQQDLTRRSGPMARHKVKRAKEPIMPRFHALAARNELAGEAYEIVAKEFAELTSLLAEISFDGLMELSDVHLEMLKRLSENPIAADNPYILGAVKYIMESSSYGLARMPERYRNAFQNVTNVLLDQFMAGKKRNTVVSLHDTAVGISSSHEDDSY